MDELKTCPFCGSKRFLAHQVCYHDVIVNPDNIFEEDAGVYESDTPYGPYTCKICGAEFEELSADPKALNAPPSEKMREQLKEIAATRFSYAGRYLPVRAVSQFSDKDWRKVMGKIIFPEAGPAYNGQYMDLAKRLLSFAGASVCIPDLEEDLDAIMQRGQLWLGNRSQLMKGEGSRCHSNVSELFRNNRDEHEVAIATGYALSDDGIWRQHSWLLWRKLRSVSLVETTEPRLLYYGFVMTHWEGDQFMRDNL